MTETTDWSEWRSAWRTRPASPDDLAEARARFSAATRRATIIHAIEWVMTALAIGFPLVAIRHAANLVEAGLGIGAVAIVAGVSAFRGWNRRAENNVLAASARAFDDAVRSLRRAELHFTRFLWLVLGVESVFAGVWWYGGIEVHHDPLTPIAIGMLWVPLLVAVVVLAWSIRLHARAKRELANLEASRQPG